MAFREARNIHYVIGLARNDRLVEKSAPELLAAKVESRGRRRPARHRPARLYAEFPHATRTSWSRFRRVIAKAEHIPGKRNPRFVVTSLPLTIPPRTVYERIYCPRGNAENAIKEQQLDLFADRTSATPMAANQLRLLFSAFASILMIRLRDTLAHTRLGRATAGSLRLKLLKIGGPRLRLRPPRHRGHGLPPPLPGRVRTRTRPLPDVAPPPPPAPYPPPRPGGRHPCLHAPGIRPPIARDPLRQGRYGHLRLSPHAKSGHYPANYPGIASRRPPPGGPGRVRGWRGARRVRCVVRRFRFGTQSGSRRSVSTPLLIEPDVRISRIRLSAAIMPSPTEGLRSSAQGASGRSGSTAIRRRSARIFPPSPCASAGTTVAAAGSHAGPRPCRPCRPARG